MNHKCKIGDTDKFPNVKICSVCGKRIMCIDLDALNKETLKQMGLEKWNEKI